MIFDRVLKRRFIASAAILLVASLAMSCARERTAEEAVRDTLAAMEKAAEERDVSAVMGFVAPDFTSDAGDDRASLRNFVHGYFGTHPSLELLVRIDAIEFPANDLARVQLGIASATRRDTTLTSLDVDLETLQLELTNDAGQWRLRRADRASPP